MKMDHSHAGDFTDMVRASRVDAATCDTRTMLDGPYSRDPAQVLRLTVVFVNEERQASGATLETM